MRLISQDEGDGNEEDGGYVSFASALGRDANDVADIWDGVDIPHFEVPVPNKTARFDVLNKFISEAARCPARRSLWLGKDSLPHSFDPSLLGMLLDPRNPLNRTPPPPPSISHFNIFAAPFVIMHPDDFLRLIIPPPPTQPSSSASTTPSPALYHLEITFFIDDGEANAAELSSIFALLSPSLTHLTLRIVSRNYDYRIVAAASRALSAAIGGCRQLRSLSLGGHITDYVFGEVSQLSLLEHLVVLPACHLDEYGLERTLRLPSSLRTLTYSSYSAFAFEPETALWYASVSDECKRVGATFRDEKRPKEVEWLGKFAP